MLVLLDNGHGGIINGIYQTSGKRSPVWSDGTQLFEGEFNRAIVNGIIQELTRLRIPYVHVSPEYEDVSLPTRSQRANNYAHEECFLLSVHSNATDPPGIGDGWEVYTYPNISPADEIAEIFANTFREHFPDKRLRHDASDGDLDKEANFHMLRETIMPAILTENFFMDNEEECRTLLLSSEGRQYIIDMHIAAIKKVKIEVFGGVIA